MRRRLTTLVPLLGALALFGCSHPSPASPSATKTHSATPSASPSAAGPVALRLGQTFTKPNGRATLAALAAGPGTPAVPNGQSTWYPVHLRLCVSPKATGGPWTIDGQFWNLLLSGGGASDNFVSSDIVKQPEWPAFNPRSVTAGDCVDGWATFDIANGSKPIGIEYDNTSADPLIWLRWTWGTS
jgi:hypothetical protein